VASPSSQLAVFGVCVHPSNGSQPSFVQTSPSSQSGGGPPTQAVPAQVSFVVHSLPSSHGALLAALMHPPRASQLSSVQRLPSSQLRGGPPVHVPALQWSVVVQASPSSQGPETLT
jgi:hypothetical protein